MQTLPLFYQQICDWMQDYAPQQVVAGKTVLLREGEVETKLYLICEGALQVLYQTEDAAPQVIRLAYRGSLVNGLPSFLTGAPSLLSLHTIRKTVLHAVPAHAMKAFFLQSPENADAYRQLLESLLAQQFERELDLLQPDPAVRYQRVLERSPQLFAEIPLRYIASYLRMTPETLSRIRKS